MIAFIYIKSKNDVYFYCEVFSLNRLTISKVTLLIYFYISNKGGVIRYLSDPNQL